MVLVLVLEKVIYQQLEGKRYEVHDNELRRGHLRFSARKLAGNEALPSSQLVATSSLYSRACYSQEHSTPSHRQRSLFYIILGQRKKNGRTDRRRAQSRCPSPKLSIGAVFLPLPKEDRILTIKLAGQLTSKTTKGKDWDPLEPEATVEQQDRPGNGISGELRDFLFLSLASTYCCV